MSLEKTPSSLASVSSSQIVDGSITSSKIVSSSVNSSLINSGASAANLFLQSNGLNAAAFESSEKSVLSSAGDILYASAANTLARLAIGSNGLALKSVSGLPSWASIASISVSSFTANGTWTKPTGATGAWVLAIGGGGSGAAGGRQTNHNGSGASGGMGGQVCVVNLDISSVSTTASVTIGAGGIAVNGATSSGTPKDGNDGGNTIFGSFLTVLGGARGLWMAKVDTIKQNASGNVNKFISTTFPSVPDGNAGWASDTLGNRSAYNAMFFAGGGGAGGTTQGQTGGRGGTGLGRSGTGPAGGATGQDAASGGTNGTIIGDGGGGAGAHNGGGTPYSGGAGYLGGGGGGGGMAATTNTGGNSGAGGGGYLLVVSF